MSTKRIVATAVAAGLVGASLVGVPAVLAADNPSPASSGAGWGDGDDWPGGSMMGGWGVRGSMMGGRMPAGARQHGMPGWGARGGGCDGLLGTAAQGTLTTAQERDLAAQAEVEKLSHDVYLAFADSTGDPRFEHIAWSETRHLAAVRTLLDRYDVTDPTAGDRVGEFDSDPVRAAYEAALDQGSGSLQAALDVAAGLERTDIDGLKTATDGLAAPDVEQVYSHLVAASRMHLRAFSG